MAAKKKATTGFKAGDTVLVRDNRAGVHVGTLVSNDQATKTAVLKDARKIWYWKGALSVHDIAAAGLDAKASKISAPVALVGLNEVVETVLCSKAGGECVLAAPVFKA